MDNVQSAGLTTALIENLVENYSEKLLNRAYHLLSNKEDAEDVVQEVFLAAYDKRDSITIVASVEAWLFGVLNNKIIDLYKKRYKNPIVNINFEYDFDQYGEWRRTDVSNHWQDSEEALELLLDDNEFQTTFYECIEKLQPRWKIVVKLCYLQSQSATKICTDLNISSASYWKMLQRSRLQLRECIDINWFNK